MGAFPSGSVNTGNLNAGTDKPKDARTDLLNTVNKLNSILASFNDANGICGLNSSSKIDSAKLSGVIGTGQIVDNAVTYAKMQNVTQNTVLGRKTGQGTGDPQEIVIDHNLGDGNESHSRVVSSLAVKNYVDANTAGQIFSKGSSAITTGQGGALYANSPRTSTSDNYQNLLNIRFTPSSSSSTLRIENWPRFTYQKFNSYNDSYMTDGYSNVTENSRLVYNGSVINPLSDGGRTYEFNHGASGEITLTMQINANRVPRRSGFGTTDGQSKNFRVSAGTVVITEQSIPNLSITVASA